MAAFIEPPEPPPVPTTFTYSIRGWVINSDTGLGVSGATVRIYANSALIKTVTSGSTGSFSTTYRTSQVLTTFKAIVSKSGFNTNAKTIQVDETIVDFGNIYITPLPSYDYTIHGTVTDDEYGWEVPESYVSISKWTGTSWVSIGTTATPSDSGDYSFSYTSVGTTVSKFKTVVSKVGYETKTTEASVTGTDCEINTAFTRTTTTNLITSNTFEYANQEAYELWWTVDSGYDDRYSTTCEDGIAVLSEVDGVPDQSGLVSVRGTIDLSMWTESGDLTITVRFRALGATSSNIRMWLAEPLDANNIHWTWYDSWSTSDTGWITISDTIYRSGEPDGFSDSKTYSFYWGYVGVSSDSTQCVMIDSIEIEGDKCPEGVLTQTHEGVAAISADTVPMVHTNDDDEAVVLMTTKFGEGYTSLGIGHEPDPTIKSGIWVTMDDDFSVYTESEGGITYYVLEYSTVDYVRVNIEIVNADGTPLPNQPELIDRLTNEEFVYGESGEVDLSGAIGICLEMVGLMGLMANPSTAAIATIAPLLKFAGHILVLGVDTTHDNGRATLTTGYDQSTTAVWVELDYDDVTSSMNAYLPKAGLRDFKLELDVRPHFVDEGLYKINVDYDVVLKHYQCRRPQTFHLWTEVNPTPYPRHYNQDFDMIWYQETSKVHIVELDSTLNGNHLLISEDSECNPIKIKSTRNGVNWYVVTPLDPDENPCIKLTADPSFVEGSTYTFYEMLVSKWSIGWEQKIPAEYLGLSLTIELDQYTPFYSFGAIYT